ncbi:hypothetical protein MPLB_1990056 [Mesorhizobium sp. ORS 3324]|uniref:Uncharacterized protein n=1 Tax=Mesorhizobium plurifarium TaxID=69974 RepID=A0A090GTB2_MESPL|nr:hypothetical protein MPLB_1990056 [Mesorhizobium sp. ORS 3324]CDX44943.1 hypothetical protein MPLA_750023 [Mesorhizobium sp. ORS 3359]CDX52637.1 hypothetical protein MPL3365_170006 [Mesorhizobium plurifarium]
MRVPSRSSRPGGLILWGLAFDKLTDESAAHGRLAVMCVPGSQDEIEWSAFASTSA